MAWYKIIERMSFSGSKYPVAASGENPCYVKINYSVIVIGEGTFATISNVNGDILEFIGNDINPNSGQVYLPAGVDITALVHSDSSLWDFNIVIEEDGDELYNNSASGQSSGPFDDQFTFTPQCGSEYTITLMSNQHS